MSTEATKVPMSPAQEKVYQAICEMFVEDGVWPRACQIQRARGYRTDAALKSVLLPLVSKGWVTIIGAQYVPSLDERIRLLREAADNLESDQVA